MIASENRSNIKCLLRRFFTGQVYPAVVCIFVLLGYVTRLEVYFNIVLMLMLAVGILMTDSIRPLVSVLLVIMFQVTPPHSPARSIAIPFDCGYYFRPENAIPTGIAFAIALTAIVIFFVRSFKSSRVSFSALPYFVPSVILAIAFLLGGVFSGAYRIENLGLAFAEILGFFIIFYLFYIGFRGERGRGLLNYFVYVNALIAILLVLETVWVYYTGDVLVAVDGVTQIVKGQIFYGWGVATTAGQAITVTLPLLFYGAMKSRAWPFYISVAVLALCSVLFTLSRGAILVASLTIAACVIIGCLVGRNKRMFRILLPIGLIAAIVVASFFFDTIESMFFTLFDVGFNDNGRFKLWQTGFDAFLRAPIFGEGFWSFMKPTSWLHIDTFPPMMHNTIIQILGSMGAVGIVSYAVYRLATARTFFRYPSLGKSMVGIAILTLLAQSMLDNFIFYIQPMFYYAIALVVAVKLTEESELHEYELRISRDSREKKAPATATGYARVVGTDLVARPTRRKKRGNIKVAPRRISVKDLNKSFEEK